MRLTEHVSLAPHTTFGIGGPARFFAEAESIEDVVEAIAFARERALPIFVLGGGSNVLISDSGFNGIVIAMRMNGISHQEVDGRVLVTANAGVVWDDLVAWAVEHDFSGIEALSGVPGTVGGAVAANIGAYGAQCSDTLVSAEVIDLKEGDSLSVFNKDDCDFSYHDSVFSREPGRYSIVRAVFALGASRVSRPEYRDHRFNLNSFESNGKEPTLPDIRNAVLDIREQKGALCMPGRESYRCAGSFFHMPFVSAQQHEEVCSRARALDADKEERLRPWAWEQPDRTYKLAPGFLLEYTEFQKSYARGAVGISPRHTLSIINIDNAKAQDVIQLACDMRDAVENIFGVRLEFEVERVGSI